MADYVLTTGEPRNKVQRNAKILLAGGLLFLAWYLNFSKSGKTIASNTGSSIVGGIMNISQRGIDLIKNFEEFSPVPYRDSKGWSIGYGHYMGLAPTMNSVTMEQGLNLLSSDTAWAVRAVKNAVNVPLNQNQFDALVSLTYNIGGPAFEGSTLVKDLNAGNYSAAAAQFDVWNKSEGSVNHTLVSRRAIERALFEA